MEEDGIRYIQFVDEESRLRYTIDKFKKYDEKRKKYIGHLERVNAQVIEKNKRLKDLLTTHYEEMNELIDAYEASKPLISDKKHKAYIFELIKRSNESSKNKREVECLTAENKRLTERNKDLEEKLKALETIIINKHNG